MQRFSLFFLLFLSITVAWSQSDISSNSFEASYKKTNPAIIYKYDSLRQIHNYSNNWDFDKDGKPDQIYFVGTGGAHLYYFLRVTLSTDNVVRNFSFIQTDLPVLPSSDDLNKPLPPQAGILPSPGLQPARYESLRISYSKQALPKQKQKSIRSVKYKILLPMFSRELS